jgi:hypothetical protein
LEIRSQSFISLVFDRVWGLVGCQQLVGAATSQIKRTVLELIVTKTNREVSSESTGILKKKNRGIYLSVDRNGTLRRDVVSGSTKSWAVGQSGPITWSSLPDDVIAGHTSDYFATTMR